MGVFSIWHWVIIVFVLALVLYPLIGGVVMWISYLAIGRRREDAEDRSLRDHLPRRDTPFAPVAGADWIPLPRLDPGQRLAMEFIRDPLQNFYLAIVLLPTVLVAVSLVALAVYDSMAAVAVLAVLALLILVAWITWKLLYVYFLGHCIKVSATQYPQLFRLIEEASQILGIRSPSTFIMQGHGLFETLVIKRFSRRGVILLTSNLLDDLSERGSSREIMFFIGRQLGLMATGYFRFWFLKSVLGKLAVPFYVAYQRRCHFTADRLGLLVAGDLLAAEQALIIITSGCAVAPSTTTAALEEQRNELLRSVWSWIRLSYSSYPYMVDRIIRLRKFALNAALTGIHAKQPIGTLPLAHGAIRSLPLMIVHGHDLTARLELENFLFKKFPNVSPISMISETTAALTLPEKFEEMAAKVQGAVVLATPDDLTTTTQDRTPAFRARQNVVIEIGWFWARLGRSNCLLLMKEAVELPSDLSGIEVHRYHDSPLECSEAIRDFIVSLEHR